MAIAKALADFNLAVVELDRQIFWLYGTCNRVVPHSYDN